MGNDLSSDFGGGSQALKSRRRVCMKTGKGAGNLVSHVQYNPMHLLDLVIRLIT
ncbi:hypothetical protein AYX13_01452 [Cryptococcus neoformans]|nr:hypothetical protein AYX13_01452 [Cryptococcus neoformans var. grubii]